MVNTRGAENPGVEESPTAKRQKVDKGSKERHAMSRSRSRSPSPAESNREGKIASIVVIPSTSRKSNVRPSHSSSERQRNKSRSIEKHSEPSMDSVLKDLTDVFKKVENSMANMDSKMSGLSELSGNIQGMNDKMSEGFQSLSQSLQVEVEGGGSGNDEDEWKELGPLDEGDNLINDLFSDRGSATISDTADKGATSPTIVASENRPTTSTNVRPSTSKDIPGTTCGITGDEEDSAWAAWTSEITLDLTVGENIHDKLQAFFDERMTKPLNLENANKKGESYKRPNNVNWLKVPEVQDTVWLGLPGKVRDNDMAKRKQQEMFMKMLTAMLKVAEQLKAKEKSEKWVLEPMRQLADAFAFASYINRYVLIKNRREEMRPHLPVEYRRLANDSNSPSASMLFGDDLDGALKSMEQSAKFVKKMSDNKRYHNSDSFRGRGRGRGSYINNNTVNRGRYTRGRGNNSYRGRGRGRPFYHTHGNSSHSHGEKADFPRGDSMRKQ